MGNPQKPFLHPGLRGDAALEAVRRQIRAKVHRNLDAAVADIAKVVQVHHLTYSEFMFIADVMVQSYDALAEIAQAEIDKAKGKIS